MITCEHCRFKKPIEGILGTFICVRYPPTPFVMMAQDPLCGVQPINITSYPNVSNKNNACGEFVKAHLEKLVTAP